MIDAGFVRREVVNGTIRYLCDFSMDGDVHCLWYEFDESYDRFASIECGDAFFVPLALLAHSRCQDLKFATEVSSRLHEGVVDGLLPGLQILSPNPTAIRVDSRTRDFGYQPSGVGTAMSLGVDSFHSLVESMGREFPVSQLTLFNGGSFGGRGGVRARELFRAASAEVSSAASALDLPLLVVDSNLSEVLSLSFTRWHSIRNLSCSLLFPKLFRYFYYASGYPITEFRLDANVAYATHYDLLVSKALRTESMEVLISGMYATRLEKLRMVADYSPSHDLLNVCVLAESNANLRAEGDVVRNCSQCHKCVKTLVALDVLGELESYSGAFDLDSYRRNRDRHLARILYGAMRVHDPHAEELVASAQATTMFKRPSVYGHFIGIGLRGVVRKAFGRSHGAAE